MDMISQNQKLKIYFAAGWFTPEQKETYDICHSMLDEYTDVFDVFYPKEKFEIPAGTKPSKKIRRQVFLDNLNAITESNMTICSTEGKDVGAIMESGYAYATNTPIIYVCFSLGDKPLNLMLQEAAIAVSTKPETLKQILDIIKTEGMFSASLTKFLHTGTTE